MILLAILLATLPAPELVAQADEANGDYIGCLYAQSRAAHGARLPAVEFKRRLANACLAEQQSSERLTAKVLEQRGETNATVAAKQLSRDARASVIATYEKLPSIERQLKKVAEICRERPEACE